nr:hypothetical protein L203_05667 [Cryptococcus depauperatus CBS 7841]
MLRSISAAKLVTALVVLGLARACWYYVYMESPYDYVYRHCSAGCDGMKQDDPNFKSCCFPYTSGQATPGVCTSLMSSFAASGTKCVWGNIPTSGAPQTSKLVTDTSYVPPTISVPVTTHSEDTDCLSSTKSSQPGVITQTSWVTSTTTTPCTGTTSQAAVPTTSSQSSTATSTPTKTTTPTTTTPTTTTPSTTTTPCTTTTTTNQPCDCGETSKAAQSTSSNWEGNTPSAGFTPDSKRKRGVMRRGQCQCHTQPGQTSTNWEGNTAPGGFSGDNRKRFEPRNTPPDGFHPDNGRRALPTTPFENGKREYSGIMRGVNVHGTNAGRKRDVEKEYLETLTKPVESTVPTGFSKYYEKRETPSTVICTSTTWITTNDCGKSTSSITSTTPTTATSTTTNQPCDCGETSKAAQSTSSHWEGNTPSAGFTPDSKRKRGVMRRDGCHCTGESGQAGASTTSTGQTSSSSTHWEG